jgi:foldase protein PrsA
MKDDNDIKKDGLKKETVAKEAAGAEKKDEKLKGKEETVIKYGFIALGIILVISILAFAIINFLPQYALSVGDEKIPMEEFEYHYFEQKNMVYQQIAAYYPDITEEVLLMSEYSEGVTYHEMIKQLALERVADIAILLDMAEKEGYVYDEAELKDSKNNFRASFEQYAQQTGMKVDEVAEQIYGTDFDTVMKIYEKSWISGKYQDDLMEEYKKDLTEEETIEYYEMYKDDLDSVTLKQLFIATYDTESQQYYSDEDYQDAKNRAEEIFERIQNGENMDELILELSEDPTVTETMGEYKSKKSEIGLSNLEEWAFSQERAEGDIDLVETEIGFHIVKFMERTDYEDSITSIKDNIAYGMVLDMLSQKKQLPEYEIGYYDAFKKY